MTSEEAKEKYLEYLEGHIGNVKEAFELLCTLDIPFINEHKDELEQIISEHDKSKYDEPEWTAYLHHFYPTCDEDSLKTEEFEEACRHHVNENPHHWDYWVKDGNLIEYIDEEEYKLYTVERLCDHMAMSIQNDNKPSDWYFANKDNIIMPDYGYNLYEEMLEKIPEDYDLSFHGTRTDGEPERDAINESIDISKLKFTPEDVQSVIAKTEENMKNNSYSKYVDFVDINLVDKYKEYDRMNNEREQVKTQEKFEELFYNILKNGITEPGHLDFNPNNGSLKLGEGNHRLSILKYLKIDKMPIKCVRDNYFECSNKIDPTKITPYSFDCFGNPHYASDMRPIYLGNDFGPDWNGEDTIEKIMNEDLPMNKEYVDSLGKRVKRSKTSNTIEIDTSSTNHDAQLNEMKLSQIKQKSKSEDPERIERSKKVKTEYLGMSKFGILNFKTSSQFRSGYHYQTIEFKDMKPFEDIVKAGKEIMPDDIKKQLQNQDVNIFCTDESFSYWSWAHQAYKNDFLYIDDRIPDLKTRIQAPTVNNVRLNGGACKHILSVIDYCIKPFVLLAISQDMNKYISGSQEDKMSKQTVATQNQYDQVANWDWSDIEEYTGLSKIQILSDISKTLQIVPSINKEDIITDIVSEALPNEDAGLKREIINKIEEVLENEGK